jgi:ABC-2 type transport system permease protein
MLQILLVMKVVFEQFFGRNIEHFTTYLFAAICFLAGFSNRPITGCAAFMGMLRYLLR